MQILLIVLAAIGLVEAVAGFCIVALNYNTPFPSSSGMKLAERLFISGMPIWALSLLALYIWF